MSDVAAKAYNIATLILFLTLANIALGLVLERAGILPGATQLAVSFSGPLFLLTGVAGLILILVDWKTRDEPEAER